MIIGQNVNGMKLNNNKRFFLNIFSEVLAVYGLTALLCVIAAAYTGEESALVPLGAASAVCGVTGIMIRRLTDLHVTNVRPRINYIAVIISWLTVTVVTSAVFYCAVDGSSWYDSVFEAVASLTTTGTGMLGMQDIPRSMMLFRSMLNWLGGAGIILIAASCLPSWEFSGRSLISVEIPGAEYLATSSSYRLTCRRIFRIYLGFTASHFVLLLLAGMPVFTSLLTALSNISTSGLQHIGAGVITHLPAAQKIIITFFSFTCSLNISFFLILFYSKGRRIRRDSEIIFYACRIIITAAVIAALIALSGGRDDAGSLGDSLMQTVSFLSTSGYIVTDCAKWPHICQMIILLQMFIGACAVSTGGGIKNARIIIGFRSIRYSLFRHVHPNAVKSLEYNKEPVRSEHFVQANLYIALFMLVYIIGALLLSIGNKNESIYDALIYSQAMLTNTGTTISGTAVVLSPLSKIVMSVEMLCGRLEIYPVLMMFFSGFWKTDSNR